MIVNLHVTLRCNLRCDYCYAAKSQSSMSEGVAEEAIRLAEDQAQDIHIVYFGGEPLLERALIEHVVDFCDERKGRTQRRYHHQLATNGLLCDDTVLEYAAAHRVSLSLSLDGTQQAHDAHRRTAAGYPSWKHVVDRIPAMLRRNPYLHAQLVVSPDTAALLDQSVDFIMSTGIRHLSTCLDHNASWDRRSLRVLEKAYKRLALQYVKRTLRSETFFLSCFDIRLQSHVRGACREHERCAVGFGQFSVAPSGRLYPCVQFVGEDRPGAMCIGHVESGFDEAARRKTYASSQLRPAACVSCELRGRCVNWCACVSHATTGTLGGVSPFVCEHERMLMPIVDELGAKLFKRRNRMFLDKQYDAAFPILTVISDLRRETHR